MAVPIPSFSDVLKALEICKAIYDIGFDPERNAAIKYTRFRDDIRQLQTRLEQYEDAIDSANYEIGAGEDPSLQHETNELIGDFLTTVEECRDLLQKYVRFENRSSFLTNAYWSANIDTKVEVLRKRLQEHTSKIAFYVDPITVNLGTETLATSRQIFELLLQHFGLDSKPQLPKIPDRIVDRFLENLNKDAPSNTFISSPADVPLREGIYALRLHFSRSTVQSTGPSDVKTPEQYLNLQKAHWLATALSQSRALNNNRGGQFTYHRRIAHLEERIARQYARDDVLRFEEDELLLLDEAAFAIWPQTTVFEEKVHEIELARVSLARAKPQQTRQLIIFRKDQQTIRTVLVEEDQASRSTEKTVLYFDLTGDSFVPLYTVTANPKVEWAIELGYSKGKGSQWYPLLTRSDARQLQQAFFKYVTSHSAENVTCTLISKRTNKKSSVAEKLKVVLKPDENKVFQGELQIWHWPEQEDGTSSPDQHSISRVNTENTVRSGSSNTAASRGLNSIPPSVVSISETEKGGELAIRQELYPPFLFAFLRTEEVYTIWQIDVSDLIIQLQDHERTCALRHRHGIPFPIKRLSVSDLSSWNLCAFGIADLEPSKDVKHVDCTFLHLEFLDASARNTFQNKLYNTLKKHTTKRVGAEYVRRGLAYAAEKPSKTSTGAGGLYQLHNSSSRPYIHSSAPTLSLQSFDRLTLSNFGVK